MNNRYKAAVVAVVVMILIVNPTLLFAGNPIPGRWEKVAETKKGEKINVLMKNGITHQCRYVSANEEFLICSIKNRDNLQLDLVSIDKIVIPKAGKYAGYGALLGAAGGLGASALLVSGADASTSTGGFISFMAVCAGLGAAVGAGMGGSGETIYISKGAALAK